MASQQSHANDNTATMRRFIYEVQAAGDLSLIDNLIHQDFYDHTLDATAPQGREAARSLLQYVHTTLSGINIEIVHCVSDGEIVAVYKILRATQTGTGSEIEMGIMDFTRFEDGMFREHWANVEQVGTAIKL